MPKLNIPKRVKQSLPDGGVRVVLTPGTSAREKQKRKSLSNRENVLVDRRRKNMLIAGLNRGLHKFGLKTMVDKERFGRDHYRRLNDVFV